MTTRRGVSEIVASMIVLVVVCVLGVMLYNVSLDTMNRQQNTALSDISFGEKVAQERFEIVSVTKTQSAETNLYYMMISVVNYGNTDINITDVYVNNFRYQLTNKQNTLVSINTVQFLLNHAEVVGQSEIKTIVLDNIPWQPTTKPYDLVIVSKEGVSNAETVSI